MTRAAPLPIEPERLDSAERCDRWCFVVQLLAGRNVTHRLPLAVRAHVCRDGEAGDVV